MIPIPPRTHPLARPNTPVGVLVMGLLIVTVTAIGPLPTALATTFPDVAGTRYEQAVFFLSGLEKDGRTVITGDYFGRFRPLDQITRSEALALLTRATGNQSRADGEEGPTPFTDVDRHHWATGYINFAQAVGWAQGTGGGAFEPDQPLTYQQWVAMLVRALGYEEEALTLSGWPRGYEIIAYRLGLTEGVNYISEAPALRGEVALMAYNAVAGCVPAEGENPLAVTVFGISQAHLAPPIQPETTISLRVNRPIVGIGETALFTASVYNPSGRLLCDARVVWSAQNGVINDRGEYAPVVAGPDTITASYGDAVALEEIRVYGEPYQLTLAGVDSVVANGATAYQVTVAVTDIYNTPVPRPGVEVQLLHEVNNGAIDLKHRRSRSQAKTGQSGQATLVIIPSTVGDRTDTLKVIDVSGVLAPGVLSVSSTMQTASGVELSAVPKRIAVNAPATSTISATVVDQVGVPMLEGMYELSFTMEGVGTWDDGTTDDLSVWVQCADSPETTQVVRSIVAEQGLLRVTVSSDGLNPGTVTVECYVQRGGN